MVDPQNHPAGTQRSDAVETDLPKADALLRHVSDHQCSRRPVICDHTEYLSNIVAVCGRDASTALQREWFAFDGVDRLKGVEVT